jgi:ABC-type enterochelin transport system permease subunit
MSANESSVNIKYEPFKEIVIMEQTRFNTPDDMARFTSVIAGGKLAGLYWAEGVVFLYFPLPPSNTAVAKMLIESGKVYWTFVGYALMPRYLTTIETKEKMIIPVIDISANSLLSRVARWLKDQK